jgi:uncharacterized membrane protein (DUF485 family)
MEKILTLILKSLPLIFAFGFLVPVFTQSIDAIGWVPPFGISSLVFAIIVAGIWGLIAQIRGSWI